MSFAVLFIWSFHFFPQHGINRMSPMTYAVCAISANKLLKELCFWMVNVHAESWMTWQTTDSSFFSVAYAFIGYCLVLIFFQQDNIHPAIVMDYQRTNRIVARRLKSTRMMNAWYLEALASLREYGVSRSKFTEIVCFIQSNC